MSCPTIYKQHEMFDQAEEENKNSIGESYAIPIKWFNKWKVADDKKPFKESMNCKKIADKMGIKESLQQDVDYKIVTAQSFKLFQNWFTVKNPVKVMKDKANENGEIKLFKRKERYNIIYINLRAAFDLYPSDLVEDLYKLACTKLVPENTIVDISYFENSTTSPYLDMKQKLYAIPSHDFVLRKRPNQDLEESPINGKISIKHVEVEPQVMTYFNQEQEVIAFQNDDGVFMKVGHFTATNMRQPYVFGLTNLGNTCYFNASLQCLLHIPVFTDYFLNNTIPININNNFGTGGNVTQAMIKMVLRAASGNSSRYNPSFLLNALAGKVEEFADRLQHDAHELITFLLDLIHEDLNMKHGGPPLNVRDGNGEDDDEIFEETRQQYLRRSDSFITQTFQGYLKSTLTCPICNSKSVRFDPFTSLSVPIPNKPLSKNLTVVPYDPTKERIELRFTDDDNIDSIVQKVTGRGNPYVIISANGKNYDVVTELSQSKNNFALELNSEKMHAIYFICANTKRGKPILDGPFTIELESETETAENLAIRIRERHSYYYSDIKIISKDESPIEENDGNKEKEIDGNDDDNSPSKFFQHIKDSLVLEEGKEPGYLEVELERHLFSKTMRFKPEEKNPLVSRRRVTAVIDASPANFDWSRCRVWESPGSKAVALEDCLALFAKDVVLSEDEAWRCEKCQRPVCATKSISVWQPPRVLIVHLKRFTAFLAHFAKDTADVSFPFELQLAGAVFRLHAWLNHQGTISAGHYTAEFSADGRWYYASDLRVSERTGATLKSSNAYILFYVRED